MHPENKKLLNLALQAYEKGLLDKKDRTAFSRDHKRFLSKELGFRELMEAIQRPTGDLKEAMKRYYTTTIYNRTFK